MILPSFHVPHSSSTPHSLHHLLSLYSTDHIYFFFPNLYFLVIPHSSPHPPRPSQPLSYPSFLSKIYTSFHLIHNSSPLHIPTPLAFPRLILCIFYQAAARYSCYASTAKQAAVREGGRGSRQGGVLVENERE